MELQQLQHFLALVRLGNIGRAADALGITPSGLSRSVKSLETFLGLPLFVRQSRGVTITSFGEALLPHAHTILNERQRAIGELEALRSLRAGRVKVALHPVFDDTIVAHVIDCFTARFPEVELDLWSGTEPEITRRELAGDYDFAFSFFPKVRDEEALLYEHLLDMTIDICAPGDGAGGVIAMTEEELLDAEWVLLGANAFRRFVDDLFRSHGSAPPRKMRVCSSLALLRSLLDQGRCLTLLPRFVWQQQGLQLSRVDSFIAPSVAAAGLVYGRTNTQSLPSLALLDFFRAEAANFARPAPHAGGH